MRAAATVLGACIALMLLAAPTRAADSTAKVKGVGSAEVKWNAVPFREELMKQLAPGLTWRLGAGDATRLKLHKMALVAPDCMLLPGEMTLNLRYWSQTRWELVVFEENRWNWGEDVTMFGVAHAEVGKEPVEKKATKKLSLELVTTTKGKRAATPGAVITGDGSGLTPDALADDVPYGPEARKEFDAVPVVELHMRFGPHYGLCRFMPAKTAALKGKKADGGKLHLVYAKHVGVLARTEWLEKHEGELTFAVMDQGAPGGAPVTLTLTGGEVPSLWPVKRKNGEELDPVEGRRVATKKTPKTLEAELKGGTLTVHLANVDYVFDL